MQETTIKRYCQMSHHISVKRQLITQLQGNDFARQMNVSWYLFKKISPLHFIWEIYQRGAFLKFWKIKGNTVDQLHWSVHWWSGSSDKQAGFVPCIKSFCFPCKIPFFLACSKVRWLSHGEEQRCSTFLQTRNPILQSYLMISEMAVPC